mgnify:FL=1
MRISLFSFLYRSTRLVITRLIYFYQKLFSKPKDLEPAVKIGDGILGSVFIFKNIAFDYNIPKGCEIDIYNLKFPSPLIGSSFKSDANVLDMWLRMGLGSIIFKTIMKEERKGNPRPRLQEVNSKGKRGLFNSLGLPGPGIKKFTEEIKDHVLWEYDRPIGISIGGDNKDDYYDNIQKIEKALLNQKGQYFYELNISCPNTINGQTICEDPRSLHELLSLVKKKIKHPISIKVSPDISNITLKELGEVCQSFDRIIINAGNTHYRNKAELGLRDSNFSMNGGGLSGVTIFDRTVEMVKLFSNFKIPIMATGGISTIDHIKVLKDSGASLFGMATSLVLDPYCVPRINRQF